MLVLDACIVISFANAGHFSIIEELGQHRVCIAQRAAGEVTRDPAKSTLAQSIQAGKIELVSINLELPQEQSALALYDARPAFRGRGDAEVLALASTRGYVVASDESAIRTASIKDIASGNHIAGSLDLLRWAIAEQRVSQAEALTILRSLDCGPTILFNLKKQHQSIEDLLK